MKRFNKWRKERQIGQKLEEIPKEQLDGILQLLVAEIRKNDGTNYEPGSLRTMIAALDRHLREKGSTFRILKDREFDASRKVLNGKAIELQEQGKRKHRADPVTEEEVQIHQTNWVSINYYDLVELSYSATKDDIDRNHNFVALFTPI